MGKNMSTYAEDARLSRGTGYEKISYDPNTLSQEQKAGAMPPYGYSMTCIDRHPVTLLDAPFTSPATTPLIPDQPGFPASFSSLMSSWGHQTLWTRSPKMHSGIPGEMGQGAYYTAMHGFHNSPPLPGGPSTFGGSFVTTPGLRRHAPTTQDMDVKPGQYNTAQLDNSAHFPVLKRRKCEQTADQLGGEGMYDRRFTCTVENCGKDFSGEWEKTRHFKSVHCPPTIGCRGCNYKQSRKDLFTEHCKKRHPGKSIEDLMVRLVTPSDAA